jgi:TonB-dependent receptor-like protein/carboxypeptidase family protein
MRSTQRTKTSAAVGGLVLLCVSSVAHAQNAAGSLQIVPVTHIASLAPGSINGVVRDDRGIPVAGAIVSALGTTTSVAVSDRLGHFELRTLSPGPYLLRAHLSGYLASRGQVVEVRPSARTSSLIALRRANASPAAPPVLVAGVGPAPVETPAAADGGESSGGADNHGELAWRLRHARRGILKDATVPDEILVDDTPPDASVFGPIGTFGHAVGSPARLATNLFAGTPFTGQVNLVTTGTFDSPQQLFSPDNFSRSIAYLALGAPVGEHADWTVRAALTQGDISSWIVAGEYTTRAPARHRYELGWSYSTQRYDGGNFAALTGVTDGSRNAGMLSGFDTFSLNPAITLTYGGRYARYDYLDERSLLSPRVAVTVAPASHFRISGALSRRAVAPGAEEFMPRMESGVWLPPQRTFSSLNLSRPLDAERTDHMEVGVEQDIASATLTLRTFHQHISDQIVTLFGIDMPGVASHVGHYFIGSAGDGDATGWSGGIRASFVNRVHGAVEYSTVRARLAGGDEAYLVLFAPSALRRDVDRIHDVATSLETDVPETSTRVVVLYRVSNAFARPLDQLSGPHADRAALDSRFDVQVHQSLPFMDFSTAKWEMLVGVRNFFRETAADQSVFDELLVVRPPKRVVGGITLKF